MDKLDKVREELDVVNIELIKLLETRFSLVDEVIKIKEENCLEVLDENRELEIMKKLELEIKNKDNEEYILEIIKCILIESKKYQRRKNEK